MKSCHECGAEHSEEDLLHLAGVWVCGPCKPTFLQRLREGAPPADADPARGTFAMGRYMVVRFGASPPPRCVRCNAPGTWRMRHSYSWHPAWLILTLFCTPLAFVIAAFVFSRTIHLDLVLCADHARERRRRLLLAGVWVVTGVILLLGGIFGRRMGLPVPASVCIVVSGVISILMGPLFAQRASGVLIARRISDQCAVLRGADRAYLLSLPPWTGDPV